MPLLDAVAPGSRISCRCGCVLRPKTLDDREFALYSTTLRFVHPMTEKFFTMERKQAILRNFSCCCAVVTVVTVGLLFQLLPRSSPTAEAERARMLQVSVDMGLAIVHIVFGLAARASSLTAAVPPVIAEAVVIAITSLDAVLLFVIDPWYAARILGVDPTQAWSLQSRFSDTRAVLALSALVLGSHLAFPVRWIMFVPFEVLSLLTFTAYAFVVGSSDGVDAWSTLLLLVAIVAIAAVGRRTIEKHQREALSQLISEKNMRVQTEFRLSQLESEQGEAVGQKSPKRESDHSSCGEESSRPETTDSARVFQEGSSLQDVVALGLREQWCISSSELQIDPSKVLGEGSFGRVVAGHFHGSPVAVKVSTGMASVAEEEDQGEHDMKCQLQEVRMLRRLRHPNIALFHGAVLDVSHGSVLLVLERLRGMTFDKAVLAEGSGQQRVLGPGDPLRLLMDVCVALRYLHTRKPTIIHGDLKPSNIFAEMASGFRGSMRAKLLDFGLSRARTRHAQPLGGSLLWIAPEVIVAGGSPKASSDVYSLGRVLFFAVTGRRTWNGESRAPFLRLLRSGRAPPLPWPAGASGYAAACRPLVEACSSHEPGGRPSAAEVHARLKAVKEAGGSPEPAPAAPAGGPQAPSVAAAPGDPRPPEAPAGGCGQPDSARGGTRRAGELMAPLFAPTPRKTLELFLWAFLGRVNFERSTAGEGACCHYHAALRNLQGVLAGLATSGCRPSPFAGVKAQCPGCQALVHQADEEGTPPDSAPGRMRLTCFFCEGSLEADRLESL